MGSHTVLSVSPLAGWKEMMYQVLLSSLAQFKKYINRKRNRLQCPSLLLHHLCQVEHHTLHQIEWIVLLCFIQLNLRLRAATSLSSVKTKLLLCCEQQTKGGETVTCSTFGSLTPPGCRTQGFPLRKEGHKIGLISLLTSMLVLQQTQDCSLNDPNGTLD